MKTTQDLNLYLCSLLGIDTKATRAVLTIEAGKPPRLEVTRVVSREVAAPVNVETVAFDLVPRQ